jgi:hypothetical protein
VRSFSKAGQITSLERFEQGQSLLNRDSINQREDSRIRRHVCLPVISSYYPAHCSAYKTINQRGPKPTKTKDHRSCLFSISLTIKVYELSNFLINMTTFLSLGLEVRNLCFKL